MVYRVIRGTAEFMDGTGKRIELAAGDVVTEQARDQAHRCGRRTQILRWGLLKGMENLPQWTPTQRAEIDRLAAQIVTGQETRPLRTDGKPIGYLYEQAVA